ncbi:MAG: bifunctional phosphoribosyl-AMP cyclohydrolase/phosphoribosyl-ATP diphosphatase HisIE [Flavobacteriales bacterium]
MEIDFNKSQGLVPAIIQDAKTSVVLMLGYMNEEALKKTQESKKVTFFSRSKNRLWTKGEESGNFLNVVDIKLDCDKDTLLIKANPVGPTCHTGSDTCWNEKNVSGDFLQHLEATIHNRRDNPLSESYTSKLLKRGVNKVAQKVGEEAVELVIEAKDNDKELFLNEAADLMYHYLVLLAAKNYTLDEVISILKERHK